MPIPTIPIWTKPTATKTPIIPIWGKPKAPDTYDAQIEVFNQHLQEFHHQDRGDQAYLDFLKEKYPDDSRQLTGDFIEAINQTQPEFLGTQADYLKAHPVDKTFWEKALGVGSNILGTISKVIEWGVWPFTAFGIAMSEYDKKIEAAKALGEPPETIQQAMPESIQELREWLPGGKTYSEYQELSIGRQLFYEAPAWASTIVLPSATALRTALAGAARAGGAKGAAAVVTRGALAPMAGIERGISILLRLPGRTLSAGTRKVLEGYINKNAKYIRLIATQRDPTTFTLKEKILYKIFNFHNRYMTEQAAVAIKAQTAARRGTINQGITASTQTMDNIIGAVQSGKELTTRSITSLIVKNTPSEFVAGITNIIKTSVAPTITAGVTPTITGAVPGIEFRPIPTPVGKGYEIIQNGEPVGEISYTTEFPGVDGLVIDRIDIVETAQRQGLATQAVQRVLGEAEASGLPLYTGMLEPDGVQLFNALEQRGIIGLTPAPQRMLGNEVTRGVPEYAPTTAMAEWETVTGMPSEKKLRQSIMATVKTKGLSESKYRALFKKVGGTRNLTEMGADKLQSVLDAVREARPLKIHGKNVITAKTEKAIQALRDGLIAEKKLTPGIYESLKKDLGLETDRYESRELFITERQARQLIRQMNVEAEVGITEWDVRVAEGLVNKPELKASIDKLTSRIVTENKPKPKKGITIPFRKTAGEISEFPNDVGLSGTMSILRALRRFQEQLGGREVTRIYENAEMAIEQRRLNEVTLANIVNAMRLKAPQLATIVRDKDAMARIQQWLDSDIKITDVTKPDLIGTELEVAELFRARYDQWKNVVRLERFKDAYFHYGGRAKEVVADLIKNGTEGTSDVAIPDASIKDIKEAIGIYETRGETALREYLNTKDWGVIKSGYSFSQILHPKLRMYKRVAVRATSTSLHQRKGLEFLRDEKSAWERLIAYERQMIGLNLQPYYRKMDTEFRKIVDSGRISPESARDAANKISLFMREVKGYPIESPAVAIMLRMAGWAFGTLSKVPWMSIRNLHQNLAFHPDKSEIIKSFFGRGFFSNPLTKRGRLDYTDALVHQHKGVQQEQILMGYIGRTPIENLIRKTDYYHLSDKANRYMSMQGSGAKAERALKQYLKDRDVAKFLKNSGANELSATEQIRILEYLALETYGYGGVLNAVSGGEAAIRDIANRITTLNHFNYVRYLRSTIEMGEIGRIAGSLVAFPRSVGEKYADIFSRIKRLSGADRKRAIHSLIAIVVGSVIASELLKTITGKKRDAYNPLLVLQWQVGGLATGATQDLMELYRLITNLTFAEEEGQKKFYMDELITLIPRLGDMFIPFYAVTMNLLESLTGSRYLDRKQLRKLREVFDENYEMNEEYYQVERDMLEGIQHGLFGSRTPDPSDLEKALKDLEGLEGNLGYANKDGDIYTTSQLGSDIDSAVYGLDPSELITENGFSSLVLARADYQVMREAYFDVNADKRYDYREENPEVDANLFFWSYVVTLQSDKAEQIVQNMIRQFNIPPSSIRGYEKVFGAEEGGIPVWGEEETQEPTIPSGTEGRTPVIPVWGK